MLSTGPHHQREGRYELDREFLYPGIVGIDVARRGGQLSGATSQYELFYDQRRRSVLIFPGGGPGPMFCMGTGPCRCGKIFATFRNGSAVGSVNRLSGLSINAGVARMNVWRLAVRGNRRKLVSAAV